MHLMILFIAGMLKCNVRNVNARSQNSPVQLEKSSTVTIPLVEVLRSCSPKFSLELNLPLIPLSTFHLVITIICSPDPSLTVGWLTKDIYYISISVINNLRIVVFTYLASIHFPMAILVMRSFTAGTETRQVANTAVKTMLIAAKGKASFSAAIAATPTP